MAHRLRHPRAQNRRVNGDRSHHLESAARPCWYCRWWGGPYARIHALCERPTLARVQAVPRHGCAFHEREPGVDDDAWEPPAVPKG
jgi:hypothetical protein